MMIMMRVCVFYFKAKRILLVRAAHAPVESALLI